VQGNCGGGGDPGVLVADERYPAVGALVGERGAYAVGDHAVLAGQGSQGVQHGQVDEEVALPECAGALGGAEEEVAFRDRGALAVRAGEDSLDRGDLHTRPGVQAPQAEGVGRRERGGGSGTEQQEDRVQQGVFAGTGEIRCVGEKVRHVQRDG
jgi:hypothetical protein